MSQRSRSINGDVSESTESNISALWVVDVTSNSSRRALFRASAKMTYAGPFTSQFRNELESGWLRKLDEIGVLHTPNVNMRSFLGDSVKIQNWNIAGLPKDDSSTENGIIINKARR